VIVAGAGNDGVETPFYPAAYPTVLAVAATDENNGRAPFSNFGSWVDLAAPGANIVTTFAGGNWGATSGTSLAAPLVAGVAGLVKTLHPDWTPVQVRNHLRQTANAAAGSSALRLVDAAAAVQAPQSVLTVADFAVNDVAGGHPTPDSTGNTLVVRLRNDWYDATGVTGLLTSTDPNVIVTDAIAAFGDIASGATASSPALRFTLGPVGFATAIPLALTVTANNGAYVAQLPVAVTTRGPETNVSLPIAAPTLWTADQIYRVTGDLLINAGATLTIQPGAVVRFAPGASLTVHGTLIADGTPDQPILFAAIEPATTWSRILFESDSPMLWRMPMAPIRVAASCDMYAWSPPT